MVTCDKCSKPASVFVSAILDSKTCLKQSFCLEHAKDRGILSSNAYALLEEELFYTKAGSSQTAKCSHCSYPKHLFEKTGLVGCSYCYEELRNDILRLLLKLHKGTIHVGKITKAHFDRLSAQNQILNLSQELQQLIASESFEKAAALRDAIKELESRLKLYT